MAARPDGEDSEGDGENAAAGKTVDVLVYEGAFSRLLKRIKLVSVTSCTVTCVGVPFLAAYGNQDLPVAGRAAVAFTAVSFGVLTTAAVWVLAKPYVTRALVRVPVADSDARDNNHGASTAAPPLVVVETLSLLGQPITAAFALRDMQPPRPGRPLETFFVDGGLDGGAGGGFYMPLTSGWLGRFEVGLDEGLRTVAAADDDDDDEVGEVEEGDDDYETEEDVVPGAALGIDESAAEVTLKWAVGEAGQLRRLVEQYTPQPPADEDQ